MAKRKKSGANPGELLIFGNPKKKRVPKGHKPGCKCFACKKNPGALDKKRGARDRAARIRAARLNPKDHLYEKGLMRWGIPGQLIRFRTKAEALKATKPEYHHEIKKIRNGASDRAAGLNPSSMEKTWRVTSYMPDRRYGRQVFKQATVSAKTKSAARSEFLKLYPNEAGRGIAVSPQKANPLRPRRNPSEEEQAVRLFQGFHGHDPKEILEKHVSAATRLDYTALGDLVYLKVETPLGKEVEFRFDSDGVKLASSPDGKQLYCIGGNQNILPCLDEDSQQKDFIDLGEATEVAYLARKIHGKFQPVEYYHEFGEVDGTLPRLMYDKLRKQIFFIGGNYWVDVNMPAPGTPLGKISPGIEN